MSKSKHSPEFRANISQEYIDGKGSYDSLADLYGIGSTTLKKWVAVYRIHGIDAFITTIGNKSYSKEFKLYCVEEVIQGKGSAQDIAASVNIHPTVLETWIRMYNANRELREYIPKREVYMAESRRKTTMKNVKKSLIIVLIMTVIIRILHHFMMYLMVRSIRGLKNMMSMEKKH